ncbi:hypothetical protein LTR37_014528 [Vermiconidia calcicola]|uniref:Uncharacterized protein n=1 Tax=Vermiconidia calcicola TaxID=1690605 RepID=A0ACC3MTG7_9PEZI|nr:hypothetical protein LTR37_014528 [Vermiconidia calcicola]
MDTNDSVQRESQQLLHSYVLHQVPLVDASALARLITNINMHFIATALALIEAAALASSTSESATTSIGPDSNHHGGSFEACNTVVVDGLNTVTSCVSATANNDTLESAYKAKREVEVLGLERRALDQSCTSVLTSTAQWGCEVTEPAQTLTEYIDCYGCSLSTQLVANALLGLGPVCVGGRRTIFDTSATAVATACSTSYANCAAYTTVAPPLGADRASGSAAPKCTASKLPTTFLLKDFTSSYVGDDLDSDEVATVSNSIGATSTSSLRTKEA